MKRTTIFLPDEVHEQIRREAFRKNLTMAEVIRRRLSPPDDARPTPQFSGPSPMEEVFGIAEVGNLTEDIDRDLYGFGPA